MQDAGGGELRKGQHEITDEERDAKLTRLREEEHIGQFFGFEHLPMHLRVVSAQFAYLAADVVAHLPRNPERTVALRKLLEAKDAAVRAVVAK